MPRKIPLVILLFAILSLSSIGLAHPGRLDSNGGHYVRKSGDF
ncbi:YHYH domain-containing protein [Dehalobacterium formicoaceticum]